MSRAVLLLLLLGACTTAPADEIVWRVPAGTTSATFRADGAACRTEARAATPAAALARVSLIAHAFLQPVYARAWRDCMLARGYVPIP